METRKTSSVAVHALSFFFFVAVSASLWTARAQSLPPPRHDGFIYGNHPVKRDAVLIEAWLDPVCPDSRDAWKPLKQAVNYYGPRVLLVVHPFPLPYHDNAYFTSRALHIANAQNSSATFHLLEAFFQHQEKFYNAQTRNISGASIISHIVKFSAEVLGKSYLAAFDYGFGDRQTDLKTRVSFKYGCTRGVYGTPFFFVNGFALSDATSPVDYNGWRKLIDPLVDTSLAKS